MGAGEEQREFQKDEKIIWACIDLAVGDGIGFRAGDDSKRWLDSGNDHRSFRRNHIGREYHRHCE
jgi:hypothetical protein